MNFVLFLILNAILLVRPEEFVPELAGLRLYLITIIACVVTTLPGLTARLTPDALRDRPVGICVLGVWVAGTVSLLAYRFRPEEAMDFAGEFGKVVLYYFLLVSVVETPGRFRAFVGWLVLCVLTSSSLAMVDYLGYTHFPTIEHVMQAYEDPQTGEYSEFPRLCSTGMFSDPNDLCLALTLGMLTCAYLGLSRAGSTRFVWLLPIAPMFYALTLTHSRGGLLGLLAGIGAWLFARYGGRRGVPLAAAIATALVVFIGGRQGTIEGGGTAHERLMWWAQGFVDLSKAPLYLPVGFGVNYFENEFGHVAHNSFVGAYVETGLVGGGFFFAAFYIAGRLTYLAGRNRPPKDWAHTARPYVFAALLAYAAGAFSLSRQYVLPTYLTLALVSAYLELTYPVLPDRFRVSAAWWMRLAVISVGGFLALRLLTQGMGVLGV